MEQPSKQADSSSSLGIEDINPVKIITAIGIAKATYGKISAIYELTSFILLNIINTGNNAECIGTVSLTYKKLIGLLT